MKTFRNQNKIYLISDKPGLIIITIALVIFIFACWFFREHAPLVPNTDFFAYMLQSDELIMSGRTSVQFPPVYPMLLALARFFSSAPQGELVWGRVLNVLLLAFSMYLLSMYFYILDRDLSVPVCLMILSNYLSFALVWQVNNVSLFFFLVSFVLWAESRKLETLSIFVAGAGFLVRSEAIILWIALVVKSLIVSAPRKPSSAFSRLAMYLASILPIILWEFYIYKQGISNNGYVGEILQRLKEIPNWQFLYMAQVQNIFPLYGNWELFVRLRLPLVLCMSLLVLGSLYLVGTRRLVAWYVLWIFSVLYLGTHIMFPGVAERYSYPLLIFNYVLLCGPILYLAWAGFISRKTKVALLVLMSVVFAGLNISETVTRTTDSKYYRYENILLADYMKAGAFTDEDVFITLEPLIVRYYLPDNIKASVYNPLPCIDVACLKETYSWANNIYVVIDNHNTVSDYFTDLDGGGFFSNFYAAHSGDLPVKTSAEGLTWMKIYRI